MAVTVKFFLRNSPDTIKAAVDLSREDFIEKYSNTTAGREVLFKAWDEIRAIHIPKNQTKEVKFKVVATDKKVVPFSTTIGKKSKVENLQEDIKEEAESSNNPLINAARGRDESGINEDELELSDEELKEQMWCEAQREVDFKKAEKLSKDLKPEVEITGSGKTADDPVTVKVKSNRGRRRLNNADQRDARILELLKKNTKGQDIIKIMAEEGYRVHAPQITLIKQANLEAVNKAIDEAAK